MQLETYYMTREERMRARHERARLNFLIGQSWNRALMLENLEDYKVLEKLREYHNLGAQPITISEELNLDLLKVAASLRRLSKTGLATPSRDSVLVAQWQAC